VSASREDGSYVRASAALHCSLVRWEEQVGPVVGVTENISRYEVLLRWMPESGAVDLPKHNGPICLAIHLPVASESGEQRFLHCQGRVTRV
jgi:hypothetical protein